MSAVSLLHPIAEKNLCPYAAKNPGGELARGAKKYQEFHQGLPPDRIKQVKVQNPKALVDLGTVDRIYYTREEPEGPREYYHDFGEDSGRKPLLLTDPKGKELRIMGGSFRVKDWIID